MREPLIHSHITDVLSDDHEYAFATINCKCCNTMLHAGNNECMTTWVETGMGNYCIKCFCDHDVSVLDDCFGISDQSVE